MLVIQGGVWDCSCVDLFRCFFGGFFVIKINRIMLNYVMNYLIKKSFFKFVIVILFNTLKVNLSRMKLNIL